MNLTKEQILAKIEAAEAELNKPDKFEFNHSETFYTVEATSSYRSTCASSDMFKHYRIRNHLNNAEQAVRLNRESNLIGAIAEQIDLDFTSKIIWDGEIRNYYIEYSLNSRQYVLVSTSYFKTPGVVFMPKEVAEQVYEILNSNQVSLKG